MSESVHSPNFANTVADQEKIEHESFVRAQLVNLVDEKTVPTPEQYDAATIWLEEQQNTATFDQNGNLIKFGLEDMPAAEFAAISDYFNNDSWLLGKEQVELLHSLNTVVTEQFKNNLEPGVVTESTAFHGKKYAREISEKAQKLQHRDPTTAYWSDSIKGTKIRDTLDTLTEEAPNLGSLAEATIANVPMLERLEKVEQLKQDTRALAQLNIHVRRRLRLETGRDFIKTPSDLQLEVWDRDHKAELDVISNAIVELTKDKLLDVDVTAAITALEAAQQRGISLEDEDISGLDAKQKKALLEMFSYMSGLIKDKYRRTHPTAASPNVEGFMRLLNGSQRKIDTQGRGRIEVKNKIARRKIRTNPHLSEQQKASAIAKIDQKERSKLSKPRYGVYNAQENVDHRDEVYANLPKALQYLGTIQSESIGRREQLAKEREELALGGVRDKILDGLTLDRQPLEYTMAKSTFEYLFGQMETVYDKFLKKQTESLEPGERLTGTDIRNTFNKAQLTVVRGFANAKFNRTGSAASQPEEYRRYVEEMIRNFNNYDPN